MPKSLKVCMAQINLTVGAIDANVDSMLAAAEQAIARDSADIVVFPELSLSGCARPRYQRRWYSATRSGKATLSSMR